MKFASHTGLISLLFWFSVEVGDTDRFIILVLQQRWEIAVDLLSWFLQQRWAIPTDLFSWFYSRGGRYRPIYVLGFKVEVGDNDRFIILVLQQRRAITIILLSWCCIRDGKQWSFYCLGFTVEVGDIDRFIILVLQ